MDDFKRQLDEMRNRMVYEPFEAGVRIAQCSIFTVATTRMLQELKAKTDEMREVLYPNLAPPPQPTAIPQNGYTGQLNGHNWAPHGSYAEDDLENDLPGIVARNYSYR